MSANKIRLTGVKVPSDDCMKDVDGEEIPIHVDEYVVFKPKVSPGDLAMIAGWDKGEADKEKVAETLSTELCDTLASHIISWTWTDPYTGDELGKPTADVIRGLDIQSEIDYLISTWLEATGSADSKNPQ